MKKKWIIGLVLTLGLLVIWIGSVRAGGWIVFTLESWPGTVQVDEPFTIRFALRQAGQRLLEAEEIFDSAHGVPRITAVHKETGERLQFEIQPTDELGYYEAEIILPQAGSWQWSVYALDKFYMPPLTVSSETAVTDTTSTQTANTNISAFPNWFISGLGLVAIVIALYLWFRQKTKAAPVLGLVGVVICLIGIVLLPTNTVETAVAKPETQPSAEIGQILFQAKGCVSCHHHDKVNYQGTRTNIGPDLTNRDVSAEFLRIWLRNPAGVRPETYMPNLELSDAEIESLIAFLLADEVSN